MIYYVLDLVYPDRITFNALVTNSIKELNNWLGYYVNDGALPQIKVVDDPRPHFHMYEFFTNM